MLRATARDRPVLSGTTPTRDSPPTARPPGRGETRRPAAISPALRRAAWIALALGLIGLDMALPDPLLFPMRPLVAGTLVVLGIVAAAAAFRGGRRATAVLLAVAAALAIGQGLRPRIDRRSVLARTDGAALAIERHFVIGYHGAAAGRELALRGHVGGLFLTRRNVAGRSATDVAAEIAALQADRRAAGLPALIVAADQEGGPVSHLSPPLPRPPSLSTLASLPASDQQASARQAGADQGAALRSLGVTMDLAPVADLTPSAPAAMLDRHTRIATRSISPDPATVAVVAAGFATGLREAGVVPTAKHFPGLARVATDTHLFGASLEAGAADLAASDWIPFRAILSVPGAAVMLSHVAFEGQPASRSKPIVDGLLRGTWHFGGLAITDDLTMGAVIHDGLCRAVEGALNAGIDLILVSWDTDKAYTALRCALDALDEGRLDPVMLAQSERRLAGPSVEGR